MIPYETHSYTPVTKNVFDTETRVTPITVWTPNSSARIGLTDLELTQINTGSCRIRFGARGGSPDTFTGSLTILEFFLAGSQRLGFHFQTPILCPDYDLPLYVETSVSGGIYVIAQGFEA